ncbi:MAG: U32 family peptidase C-terminal domain-containing protein [Candidatus Pacebacteria bacterium]|nr:U32 family peptidase C-terminal domain-containing protein [Candidatus Paceibacterota bacterium]
MKKEKYELLAPAGNFEKIRYALEFGADAVYAGVPDFSLRARVKGFDEKSILEAIDFVHKKKKRIYLTANIFAHNGHLEGLKKHLKIYKNHLPDAFIVSDIGVMEVIRKSYPKVEIHLSTQANTTNFEAVKFWKKYGVSRVILARELSLEEIRGIHEKVPQMELEYFVHGAMCMAYSGRCFLSAWQVGRSSNLGDCAQNCRWGYALVEEKRPGEYIPVEQDNFGTYLLNSKDLCLVEYLDELKEAGITSFKIEGRAKSVSYLAQAVKSYRVALDIKPNDKNKKQKIRKIKKDLVEIVNRGYTTGFLFGKCKEKGQEPRFSHLEEKYEFVGEVLSFDIKKFLVKIRVHNALCVKDKIQVLQPKGENFFCKISAIYDDKTLEKLESAHGGQDRQVYIKINKKPQVMSILRREK